MKAKLQEIVEQLRERMHDSIPEQGRWLKAVVTRLFRISRRTHERDGTRGIQIPCDKFLASHAKTTKPEGRYGEATNCEDR